MKAIRNAIVVLSFLLLTPLAANAQWSCSHGGSFSGWAKYQRGNGPVSNHSVGYFYSSENAVSTLTLSPAADVPIADHPNQNADFSLIYRENGRMDVVVTYLQGGVVDTYEVTPADSVVLWENIGVWYPHPQGPVWSYEGSARVSRDAFNMQVTVTLSPWRQP